jgi:hypothetical protein
MGGTRAMRMPRRDYLPQEPGESDPPTHPAQPLDPVQRLPQDREGHGRQGLRQADRARRRRAAERSSRPTPRTSTSPGRNLNVFAFDVFSTRSAPASRSSSARCRRPSRAETRADEIASGRRPYLVHVKAEKSDRLEIGPDRRPGDPDPDPHPRVRHRADPRTPTRNIEIEQIRVLEPGRGRSGASDKDEDGEWVLHAEGTTTLPTSRSRRSISTAPGFMTGEPPLEDLADLNVAHWQSQSDQRNILHVARVPILFGAGFDERAATLVVGAGTMARSSDPDAKLLRRAFRRRDRLRARTTSKTSSSRCRRWACSSSSRSRAADRDRRDPSTTSRRTRPSP